MKWYGLAATVILGLAACRPDGPAGKPPDTSAEFTVRRRPPERKDVIEAVIASAAVSLDVHPSCKGVGTDPDDKSIGAYLSGFLAELEKPEDRNSIETRIAEAKDPNGATVWRCELVIRHAAGDDEWGWGVRFDIRQNDGRVMPESFVCVGAG